MRRARTAPTGTAAIKGRLKNRVSSALRRDGNEVTEKRKLLIAFVALTFTGRISQVSHSTDTSLWGKEMLQTSEED